jgi:hypothetical protein
MHRTRALLLLAGVCVVARVGLAAEVRAAKLALIEEVLQLAPSADVEALRAARLLIRIDDPEDLSSYDRSVERTSRDPDVVTEIRRSRVELYDRLFTDDELRKLIAFYRSDVGRKSLRLSDELPELVAKNILATEAARPPVEIQSVKRQKTRSTIRTLALALEARAEVVESFPAGGTIAEIAALLEPAYMRRTPHKDDWGNAIAFVGTSDGRHYRLVSGGWDGVIEKAHMTALQPVLQRTDDIVYEDGVLLTP